MVIGRVIGVGIAFWLAYSNYVSYRKGYSSKKDYLIWQLIALLLFLVSLFPSIFNYLDFLGIGRTLDFVFILTILGLLSLLFFITANMRKLANQMDRLERGLKK